MLAILFTLEGMGQYEKGMCPFLANYWGGGGGGGGGGRPTLSQQPPVPNHREQLHTCGKHQCLTGTLQVVCFLYQGEWHSPLFDIGASTHS